MYQHTSDPNVLYPNKFSQEDNPFSNFTSTTYPSQQNSQMHSFNKAFQQNNPMIEKQNFKNQNNVFHNNLLDNVQTEFIVDYTLDIDSKDREISSFPDPFKYTVTFAPVTKGVDRREEWINPNDKSLGKHIVSTFYTGNPPPYIAKSFKNIKYIRVDNVILPKYGGIKYDMGTSEWVLDDTKDLTADRFIVMKFKNIDSRFNMSTNSIVESTGIKLIPDTIPESGNFYYAVPSNAKNIVKTYNMSLLGNLDRLYVEFYDSVGNQLRYTNLDTSQPTTDVRNPNNINLQNNITLIFGVVENELATEVKFTQ
jgi:hypothetical protein